MDKSIVVTIPHNLGADVAKSRVSRGIERLKTEYLDKLARTEVNWSGNKADLQVSALGQTLNAQLDVQDDSLRIEVRLLGILSGLLNKVQDSLMRNVKGSLQLERAPPKS
ncbi:MAG TPA: polyhydroxyalkanoic acid system family protein [Methylocystis sp.]|nr:polyhydroxyalkanoic acid system family protein [Methylocystis sp.]